MSNIFKLKLTALGHPNPEAFNCEDEKEYRSVVLWLEDQKIRHYKIEEREGLRNIESDQWKKAYDTYQTDLVSPLVQGLPNEQLNWLLSYAVRLEYADNGRHVLGNIHAEGGTVHTRLEVLRERKTGGRSFHSIAVGIRKIEEKYLVTKYKNAKVEEPKKAAPNVVSSNPLDNLDFSSPTFKAGVDRICALAGVGPHPDPKFRLAAVAKILKTSPHPDHPKSEVNTVNQPVDVLKLLFIQDLRELQTKINEALVAVQTVTADPRTDTTLGRVGR